MCVGSSFIDFCNFVACSWSSSISFDYSSLFVFSFLSRLFQCVFFIIVSGFYSRHPSSSLSSHSFLAIISVIYISIVHVFLFCNLCIFYYEACRDSTHVRLSRLIGDISAATPSRNIGFIHYGNHIYFPV